jgi:hypothetical protein
MATTVVAQEKVKATFNEHLDGIYYFTDKDGYAMEFAQIQEDVLVQFDLLGEAFKGKVFMITYTTDTEEDEEGDEISINIIVGLKLAE